MWNAVGRTQGAPAGGPVYQHADRARPCDGGDAGAATVGVGI